MHSVPHTPGEAPLLLPELALARLPPAPGRMLPFAPWLVVSKDVEDLAFHRQTPNA